MSNLADMRKVKLALFATASVLIWFLTVGIPHSPSRAQWWICPADGGPGHEPLAPQATAFMLMIAFSFAVFSWCSLAVLGPHRHHTTRDLIVRASMGFAAVGGIAAVETMIGLGPFWGSRLQEAGGGWTYLVVIIASYAAAVIEVWKAIRSSDTFSTQQAQSVDTTIGTAGVHP